MQNKSFIKHTSSESVGILNKESTLTVPPRGLLHSLALKTLLLGAGATLVLGCSKQAYAESNGVENNISEVDSVANTERFNPDFYMGYNPQTLYDILENIPGANSLLNQLNNHNQSRGFGAAGDQILINSKRMSGKANSLGKELRSIQAQDVQSIELIRGSRSDLDVLSNGLIINVLLNENMSSSTLWTIGGIKSPNIDQQTEGSIVHSAGSSTFKYRFGYDHVANPTEINRDEQYYSEDSQHIQTETFARKNVFMRDRATIKIEYDLSESTALQFNSLIQKVDIDSDINLSSEDRQLQTIDYDTMYWDWKRDKWEISGDITHKLNSDNQFKLIFVSNQLDGDDKIWQVQNQIGQGDIADFLLPRLYTAKENILRGNWKHKIDTRHSLDMGLEGALNERIEDIQFIDQMDGPYHSTEENDIEEVRYEVFLNYNFTVSPKLNLQSSLIYDQSTMDVLTNILIESDSIDSAADKTSRTFTYLKPRINVRYDLNDIHQMRFNYVRTVSQLDLDDFVPWFNIQEARLELANPDLKPEVRDEISLSFERQWSATDGSLVMTPYYHKITDYITEIPFEDRSSDGNVEHAKEFGIKFDFHFGLELLGLDHTKISASYTLRDSVMEHPFTGKEAPLERTSDHEWTLKVNQNELFKGLSFNFELKGKSPYQFQYYDYLGKVDSTVEAEAFIDYQINPSFKLKFGGLGLLGRERNIEKARYSGLYSQSDFLRNERLETRFEPKFSLKLSGQF